MRIPVRSLPAGTLAIAAAALAVAAAPGWFDSLVLGREDLLRGEIWRLVTAHLLHTGTYHLVWNVGALLVVGFVFEPVLGRKLGFLLGAGALLIGVGVFSLDPGLGGYCGLSGLLNTIWIGGSLGAAREEIFRGRRGTAWFYYGCILAGLAKIAVEGALGYGLFTEAARLRAIPVPLAHALGALAGTFCLIGRRAGGSKSPAPSASQRRRVQPPAQLLQGARLQLANALPGQPEPSSDLLQGSEFVATDPEP